MLLVKPVFAAPELVSGQPVMVGAGDLRGPLSVGLNNNPVGAVNIYGGERPDLIVAAGNHSSSPGLYLFQYSGTDPNGAPVFKEPVRFPHPGGERLPPEGFIWQDDQGVIHGFWLIEGSVHRTQFDKEVKRFVQSAPPLRWQGLPQSPSRLAVLPLRNGGFTVYFSVREEGSERPPDGISWRSPDYRPFDGSLIFRGQLRGFAIYQASMQSLYQEEPLHAGLASITEAEILRRVGAIAPVQIDPNGPASLAVGAWFGNLIFYPIDEANPGSLPPRSLIPGPDGIALRHPTVNPTPISYPNKAGQWVDLIAGGEGGLYYYQFSGDLSDSGVPIYNEPSFVTKDNAPLYPGSLPVLSTIDWTGNGVLDLISGNSEGRILLFENVGTTETPLFTAGQKLESRGEPILIQQGYVAVQGPQEQRWGYSCPTAFDWNDNGLPDIVTSSATMRHKVFFNEGTRTNPQLGPSRILFSDGLDVRGTWRVQPAVNRVEGRTLYVALDEDDELRLYEKIDARNLRDLGKLLLEDGSSMSANFIHAGGKGRLKLQIVDWDLDGTWDLIIGTPRHGSVPNPQTGLPQSLGLPGAAVLFLRNVGTNEEPVFEFPTLMKFRGEPIFLGQHACGPVATDLGAPGGPNLFVGDQEGVIYYFAREDLSW